MIDNFVNLKQKIVAKPFTEVLVTSDEISNIVSDEILLEGRNLFELKGINLNADEVAWMTMINFVLNLLKL